MLFILSILWLGTWSPRRFWLKRPQFDPPIHDLSSFSRLDSVRPSVFKILLRSCLAYNADAWDAFPVTGGISSALNPIVHLWETTGYRRIQKIRPVSVAPFCDLSRTGKLMSPVSDLFQSPRSNTVTR